MIKLNPKTRLNVNTSSLMNLKLPDISIHITIEKSDPEVKRIIYIEKKTTNNKNEELF